MNAIDLRESGINGGVIANGRDCFKVFKNYLSYENSKNTKEMPSTTKDELLRKIDKAYDLFYQKNEMDVGHYFRSLYNIIKFVDRSTSKEKRIYTNLVRAQLSSNEIWLLSYNCLSRYGIEQFKPLVEKYSLLKSLSRKELLHGEKDMDLYSLAAF